MSDDRTIPTEGPADRPSFTLFSDGNQISAQFQVLAVVVVKRFNKVAYARLLIYDGSPADEDFKASNADAFAPGREIEVHAGYHSDEKLVFKGLVVRHGIRADRDGPSRLEVDCKDAAVKLTVGRKNRYFYEVTDSDAIEEVASKAGLETDVAATSVTHAEMIQFNALDWDFIVARAEANGMLVLTDNGTLKVQKPDPSAAAELTLKYGGNLLDFEAAMDARDQFSAVRSRAWDPAGQEMLALDGADPGADGPGNVKPADLAGIVGLEAFELSHAGQIKDGEAQAWADAQLLKSRLAKVRGRARIQGYGALLPGQTVELGGVGERFNGTAFVSAVRHVIDTENWETDVEFGLSPEWFVRERGDVVDADASGLLPGIEGLQIGLVTALEGDPDGEHRVQVRLPMVDAAEEGFWARVATLDAGENRGSFFRPEVGDEVVLGFLNNDPRNAVILGMLHSSARPAPLEASDDNPEKGFVTRSEMKLIFNDEEKSVTIETPNGNSFVLSDDAGSITVTDENQNKLVLSSDGISIESASDVVIKASGDIKLEATNVESTANAAFKAAGSASAEVSSSGTTKVKGSLVQIN